MTPEQYEKIIIVLMEQNEKLEYTNQRLKDAANFITGNAFGTKPLTYIKEIKHQKRDKKTGQFLGKKKK